MPNPISLIIIGADADILTTETPAYPTAFNSLPGKAEATVSCYDLGAGVALETDENEYADRRIYVDSSFFGVYKVRILYRKYPTVNKTFDEYFPELAVLKKQFKWIYSADYKIGFGGNARSVNLMNWNETRFHEFTMVELEFRHRKAE